MLSNANPILQKSFQSLKHPQQSHFHLLVPASSTNQNFCQLLLSTIILNYPPPILINWDAVETDNPFLMHMGKIDKVLAYLENFPKEQEDDLVLMVDGYDVWFQLPPEVLIRRYFDVIKAKDERVISTYGQKVAKEHDFRHTVLFGPDKSCWPDNEEGGRPACWAVPQSSMPIHAFGPAEDIDHRDIKDDPYHARPRWLNSGTIMGPVGDVRALFKAVAARVKDHYQGDSDQYYFAKIWSFQEWARLQTIPNKTFPAEYKHPDLEKEVGNSHKIEFHTGLDYDSALFQPIGYYDPFLTWLRYDYVYTGLPQDTPLSDFDRYELPEDVKTSRSPLAALKDPMGQKLSDSYKGMFSNSEGVRLKEWPELPLITNVITKQVPLLIHFLMEKDYRVRWWNRMWFAPFAKELFSASATAINTPIFKNRLNGRMWANAEVPTVPHNLATTGGRRDGAWSDKGIWLPWGSICERYNDVVFGADVGPIYDGG